MPPLILILMTWQFARQCNFRFHTIENKLNFAFSQMTDSSISDNDKVACGSMCDVILIMIIPKYFITLLITIMQRPKVFLFQHSTKEFLLPVQRTFYTTCLHCSKLSGHLHYYLLLYAGSFICHQTRGEQDVSISSFIGKFLPIDWRHWLIRIASSCLFVITKIFIYLAAG